MADSQVRSKRSRFTVPGPPLAWRRAARGIGFHGRPTTYVDKESESYRALIRHHARRAIGDAVLDCPLVLVVRAFVAIPKSWSKKKRVAAARGELRPATVPDVDNYAKMVMDALEGTAWNNDSRVVDLIARKYYAENPRLEIEFWRWTVDRE